MSEEQEWLATAENRYWHDPVFHARVHTVTLIMRTQATPQPRWMPAALALVLAEKEVGEGGQIR